MDQIQGEVIQLRGKVNELQNQVVNMENHRDIMEANLNNEVASQRRDGQLHLDLLNEETGRMDQDSRAMFLHSELQIANCGMSMFKFQAVNSSTNSEALSQYLYGTNFFDSDVRLLEDEGPPVSVVHSELVHTFKWCPWRVIRRISWWQP